MTDRNAGRDDEPNDTAPTNTAPTNTAAGHGAQHDAVRDDTVQASSRKSQRVRWLAIAGGAFLILAGGYALYWAKDLRNVESTDDAYVSGNVVQITPQVSGTVTAIGADDTQFVKAGQTLVRLDQQDARVALDQAEAHLASTVREVRNLFATSAQLQAAVEVREADLTTAREDLQRRERLGSSGAVSMEELQHARDALKASQAALIAARQQLNANRARVDGTTIADHPEVRDAAAAVRSAYLAFSRTQLPAPVSGFVARRSVQLGQRVSPGSTLMAVVPLDQVWVDANFKEPQIADIRLGQPVSLTADVYGRHVVYHGHVAGFGAGTGSAFALLPAQNATGNWIKVVQRVPVRIALDPHELEEHPLQIGLSMKANIDTHDRAGPTLPRLASNASSYSTSVFNPDEQVAEQRVRQIIASNEPGSSAGHAARAASDPGEARLAMARRAAKAAVADAASRQLQQASLPRVF